MMWFGMLYALPLMALILLITIALPALGLAWVIRSNLLVGRPAVPTIPTAVCPSCHRGTQVEWQNCPYCGQKLF